MPDLGSPLVGRHCELEQLTCVLDRMTDCSGTVVIVEGEAGIGKTALCDTVLDLAAERGARVFRAAAEELEAELPFSVITRALVPRQAGRAVTAVRDVRDALLELGVAGREEQSMRYRLVEALLDLVQSAASRQPVVVAIDDLHWADASTLLVLSDLRRLVHDLPLVVLLSARPMPRTEPLRALIGRLVDDGALRLRLNPLPPADVEALARTFTGLRPGRTFLGRLASAGGNPLYIVELIGAMRTAGAIAVDRGAAEATEIELPDSLRQVVLGRLSSLGRPTFELLRRASVLGDSFSIAELALLAGGEGGAELERVQEALDAGALASAGDRLTFRHDLVREALYLDIAQPIRKSLHRQAAAAMTAAGRPASEVARHILAGAEVGDDVAVDTLKRAADELWWADPGVAADLLEAAGGLCRAGDPCRAMLMAAEVEALLWSGRLADVAHRAREALDLGLQREAAGRVRLALVRALITLNRATEAAEVVDAAVEEEIPARERALLLAEGAIAKLGAGDLVGSQRLAALARASAPNAEARAAALVMLAMNLWIRGEMEDALGLIEEGLAELEAAHSAELERSSMLLLAAFVFSWGDRVKAAEAITRRGLRRAEELGTEFLVPLYHGYLGTLLFRFGRWNDAEAELETGLRFAHHRGHTALDPNFIATLAQIEISRGDLEAAAAHLAAADALIPGDSESLAIAATVVVARAELLLASGRPEESFQFAARIWEKAITAKILITGVLVAPVLVLAGAVTGRQEHARQVAAAMSEVASRMRTPTARGVYAFTEGLAEDEPEQLGRSAVEFDAAQRVPWAARSREEAGKRLVPSSSSREEGVSLLRASLGAYEAMGAKRDAARVSALLRASGVRMGSRAAQRRTGTGWEALTSTEREVAALAGQGLTNVDVARRLYVSHRTVETHLTRIYRKLGLSSRAALAAAVARLAFDRVETSGNTGFP